MQKIILLVEDNKYDEELTIAAFQENHIGNDIVVVRDGEEALEYLFKTGRHTERGDDNFPQLILLDLKLPKLDGFEVLKHIREDETTKYVPVVILTSSKEQEDIIKGYKCGANAYVRKPVDFEEFTKAVKYLGLFWIVLNEPAAATTP